MRDLGVVATASGPVRVQRCTGCGAIKHLRASQNPSSKPRRAGAHARLAAFRGTYGLVLQPGDRIRGMDYHRGQLGTVLEREPSYGDVTVRWDSGSITNLSESHVMRQNPDEAERRLARSLAAVGRLDLVEGQRLQAQLDVIRARRGDKHARFRVQLAERGRALEALRALHAKARAQTVFTGEDARALGAAFRSFDERFSKGKKPSKRNPFALVPALASGIVGGVGYEAAVRPIAARIRRSNFFKKNFFVAKGARQKNVPEFLPWLVAGAASGAAATLVARAGDSLARGRARRKNPLLALIGNPGGKPYALVKRRRNPTDLKLPEERVLGLMTIEQALAHPGARARSQAAIDGFGRFHGSRVQLSGDVVVIDDGRPDIDAGFLVGRTPEVTYDDVPEGSNKEGSSWGHKTSKNRPTYIAHSPSTGAFNMFGGMTASDWLRG